MSYQHYLSARIALSERPQFFEQDSLPAVVHARVTRRKYDIGKPSCRDHCLPFHNNRGISVAGALLIAYRSLKTNSLALLGVVRGVKLHRGRVELILCNGALVCGNDGSAQR